MVTADDFDKTLYEGMYGDFIADVYQSLRDHRDLTDKQSLSEDLDKVCGPDLINDINKYCSVSPDFTADDAFDSLVRRYAVAYGEDPEKLSFYAKQRGFYTFAKVVSDELKSDAVFDLSDIVEPETAELSRYVDSFIKHGQFATKADAEAFNSLLYEQVKSFQVQYDSDKTFAEAREAAAADLKRYLSHFGYDSNVPMASLPETVREGHGELNPHELTVLAENLRQQMSIDKQGMFASVLYYQRIGIPVDEETVRLLGYDYENYVQSESRYRDNSTVQPDVLSQTAIASIQQDVKAAGYDKPLIDFSKPSEPVRHHRDYDAGIEHEIVHDDKEYS